MIATASYRQLADSSVYATVSSTERLKKFIKRFPFLCDSPKTAWTRRTLEWSLREVPRLWRTTFKSCCGWDPSMRRKSKRETSPSCNFQATGKFSWVMFAAAIVIDGNDMITNYSARARMTCTNRNSFHTTLSLSTVQPRRTLCNIAASNDWSKWPSRDLIPLFFVMDKPEAEKLIRWLDLRTW